MKCTLNIINTVKHLLNPVWIQNGKGDYCWRVAFLNDPLRGAVLASACQKSL